MSKNLLYSIIAVGAILATVIIISPDNKETPEIPASAAVDASTVSKRIGYFASHGWEVEEISGKDITIPSDFSRNYEEYAVIQDKQGMPLREYAGRDAKLYVYQVRNYSPNDREMLAELLVCDDTAIASMVYSSDGGDIRMSVTG